MSVTFVVRKNWAYTPSASGPYDRQVGRKAVWLAGTCEIIIVTFHLCWVLTKMQQYYKCIKAGFWLSYFSRQFLNCQNQIFISIPTIK